MENILSLLKSIDFGSISSKELYLLIKGFTKNEQNEIYINTKKSSQETELSKNFKILSLKQEIEKELKLIIEKTNIRTDKTQIYDILLPLLINKIDNNLLFYTIYKIKELNNYTMYLLHKNKIDLTKLSISIYKHLIDNTTWGESFVLNNIDIISQGRMDNFISTTCINNRTFFYKALNSFKIQENKIIFIEKAIGHLIDFLTEDDIMASIYKDGLSKYEQLTLDDSFISQPILLPNNIGHLLVKNPYYHEIAIKHSYELFSSEKMQKMKFLYLIKNNSEELKKEYEIALKLYLISNMSYRTDAYLSNLINFGNYNEFCKKILNLSPDLQIELITANQTSSCDVFNLNDNVLKIGIERFTYNINLDFFRIIPTTIEYIRDNSNNICSITEYQKKIDTNPDHITDEMIMELFLDFKKHGLYIADPKCLKFDKSNFGLLKDYRDANLGTYKSYDELPDSFKKNPLVLLDVDLIYRYDKNELPPDILLSKVANCNKSIIDYKKIKKLIKNI